MSQARFLSCMFAFLAITGICHAQELPIAVGDDDTFCGGGAFDGTNYCVMIWGDNASPYSITAQLVSPTGSLVGSRISLGRTGSNPVVAFDGSNYLAVWSDVFPRMASGDTNGIGNLYGQFISPAGNLVGPSFTLVTGVNIKSAQGRGGLTFQDTTYLLTYCKGGDHIDHLYGQRVSRSGNLVGAPVQISAGYAREAAFAFDGTNYLVAWCDVAHPNVDRYIYGQFVSTSGELVGTNFLIDGGEFASDNPVTMTFDGTRYCVAFHERAADASERWNLFARFVSPSGVVADRFMVCDSSKSPTYASAAFDGKYYLITWMEFAEMPCMKGRYFTTQGTPVDTAFTVFGALQGKFPIGGVGGYGDGYFLVSATRVDQNMANGDIYWLFLPSLSTGVSEDKLSLNPETYSLFQNYPNPFNPSTTIRYALPNRSHVTLSVFNMLGQRVADLFNGEVAGGYHEVQFNATNLASGMYFYKLQAGNFIQTRKLLLVR
jgi:hypothetical protein